MLKLEISEKNGRLIFEAWQEDGEDPFYKQVITIPNAGSLGVIIALNNALTAFSHEASNCLTKRVNEKSNTNPAG